MTKANVSAPCTSSRRFGQLDAARLCVCILAALFLVNFSPFFAPRASWADTTFSTSDGRIAKDGSALIEGADFGMNGFERNAKGTARAMAGQPEGYRFPIYKESTLVTVTTPTEIVCWVDEDAAKKAGFDVNSADDQEKLKQMLYGLDENESMGGALLRDSTLPWVFTTDEEYDNSDYVYDLKYEGEDGDYYTVVNLIEGSTAEKPSDGAQWSNDAQLVPAADVATSEPPSFWDKARTFFTGIDYRPFWVSLKTSAIALVVSFILGLLAAWKTMGVTSRMKGVLDSLFTIPMVLPPTVCGFLLLMLFGQSTAVGRWLIAHGISLVFTWPAAVISAIVVSFPFMYRTALGAFEALDTQMLDAARTLGWSELRIFRKLMMPLGWPSIAAGTVLAFARAMGEFGCTLFFAGNYAGITQTMPIAIYFQWMGGNTPVALFWVCVVIAFSFVVILFINVYTAHVQRYRSRGLTRAERKQIEAAGGELSEIDASGGDALRIDRAALARLMNVDDAPAKGGA